MGVADVVSELRPLAAHFTYACHVPNSRIQRIGAQNGPQVPGFLQEAYSAEGGDALEGSDEIVQSNDFT